MDAVKGLPQRSVVPRARLPKRIQLEPRRATDSAYGFATLGKREGCLDLHRMTSGIRAAGARTRGGAERVIICVWGKAQEAKPFHHEGLRPADAHSLPRSRESPGER
jgi:hypothetical protein